MALARELIMYISPPRRDGDLHLLLYLSALSLTNSEAIAGLGVALVGGELQKGQVFMYYVCLSLEDPWVTATAICHTVCSITSGGVSLTG